MTSTYDESKHARSGDGKFATKDGNRSSAGQVDVFDDEEQPQFEQAHVSAEDLDAGDHIEVMGESCR